MWECVLATRFKILALHGIGRHKPGGAWQQVWRDALEFSLRRVSDEDTVDIEFFNYDDRFGDRSLSLLGSLDALTTLLSSGLLHGAGDLFGAKARRAPRAARGLTDRLRWTAGMVVHWAENDALRAELRAALAEAIDTLEPDFIFAHSLGSLIAYDTMRHADYRAPKKELSLVSLGSQIGNPFVRSHFAGRIEMPDCAHWYHLYNEHDDVLTTPIRLSDPGFEQIDCTFDIAGPLDHAAGDYLSHEAVSFNLWADFLERDEERSHSRQTRALARSGGDHSHRALIVAINAYPDPEMRLDGCVNDAFLMSALLQENGFKSDSIRLLLDERASADAIRARLDWLLDGVRRGKKRVFFFSGHGAQIPDYGPDEVVDRLDECLVPYDFDWSRERAVTDDWFHETYSQLPYGSDFVAIIDACHSGGVHRAGAGRPRGLTPPDDIRHREMFWDAEDGVWMRRALSHPNADLRAQQGREGGIDYVGKGGQRRLGRGSDLLATLSDDDYDRTRDTYGHSGPYLPVVVEACQEDQLAYEYRHGVESYGAFTYALVQALRDDPALDLLQLERTVHTRLRKLGYLQVPNVVSPQSRRAGTLFNRPSG